MLKRYFTIVGIILAGLIGLAIIGKPKPEKLRRDVEASFAAYSAANAGAALAPVKEMVSRDYILAASHQVELTDGRTVSCFGAINVVVCNGPD